LSEHPIAARWRVIGAGLGPAGQRRAALIPYLTAGFPTPARSRDALRLLEAAGADFVEVGVPFSDPLADGPTIQRSTQTALEQGMTLPRVLEQIAQAALGVPVVIMSYLNPVLAYGLERFLADAAAAGASGLLLTDLPAGADPDTEALLAASPLALIRLIAPTTPPERLGRAVAGARGFLYLIARLGVTGARDDVPPDLPAHVARVRAASDLPVAVGFGISTPAQARAAAELADGVVVGSALVDALSTGGLAALERVARELAAAVAGAPWGEAAGSRRAGAPRQRGTRGNRGGGGRGGRGGTPRGPAGRARPGGAGR
jgi:tryptophan synthase alpha chain